MKIVCSKEIIDIFNLLNENGLKYILLRNINNELPSSLEVGKDIDLLVNKKDESAYINFFNKNNYQAISHPFKNDIFLYNVDRFEFRYCNNNKILFDLNFQLAVRSLDAGQWIPLDQMIQESAWRNKRFEQINKDFRYWALSYEDEFVTLIARSIFDKRKFQGGYTKRIYELFTLIDKGNAIEKLNKVFFKFTSDLLRHIEDREYDHIIGHYLEFKGY